LDENVPVIGVAADGSEYHGDVLRTEIPARQNARWVVVDATDGDIASKIDSTGNRFLQPEPTGADLGSSDTFSLKILGKRDGFVLSDILYIEALAVQIAGFHDIVIEQGDLANAFPHQVGRDLRVDPARPDAEHAALRKDCLIESRNSGLAICGSGDCRASKVNPRS
jgi:hypothetical protein